MTKFVFNLLLGCINNFVEKKIGLNNFVEKNMYLSYEDPLNDPVHYALTIILFVAYMKQITYSNFYAYRFY